jgi:hypothetical protein
MWRRCRKRVSAKSGDGTTTGSGANAKRERRHVRLRHEAAKTVARHGLIVSHLKTWQPRQRRQRSDASFFALIAKLCKRCARLVRRTGELISAASPCPWMRKLMKQTLHDMRRPFWTGWRRRRRANVAQHQNKPLERCIPTAHVVLDAPPRDLHSALKHILALPAHCEVIDWGADQSTLCHVGELYPPLMLLRPTTNSSPPLCFEYVHLSLRPLSFGAAIRHVA